jgi:hypothetical protein
MCKKRKKYDKNYRDLIQFLKMKRNWIIYFFYWWIIRDGVERFDIIATYTSLQSYKDCRSLY